MHGFDTGNHKERKRKVWIHLPRRDGKSRLILSIYCTCRNPQLVKNAQTKKSKKSIIYCKKWLQWLHVRLIVHMHTPNIHD